MNVTSHNLSLYHFGRISLPLGPPKMRRSATESPSFADLADSPLGLLSNLAAHVHSPGASVGSPSGSLSSFEAAMMSLPLPTKHDLKIELSPPSLTRQTSLSDLGLSLDGLVNLPLSRLRSLEPMALSREETEKPVTPKLVSDMMHAAMDLTPKTPSPLSSPPLASSGSASASLASSPASASASASVSGSFSLAIPPISMPPKQEILFSPPSTPMPMPDSPNSRKAINRSLLRLINASSSSASSSVAPSSSSRSSLTVAPLNREASENVPSAVSGVSMSASLPAALPFKRLPTEDPAPSLASIESYSLQTPSRDNRSPPRRRSSSSSAVSASSSLSYAATGQGVGVGMGKGKGMGKDHYYDPDQDSEREEEEVSVKVVPSGGMLKKRRTSLTSSQKVKRGDGDYDLELTDRSSDNDSDGDDDEDDEEYELDDEEDEGKSEGGSGRKRKTASTRRMKRASSSGGGLKNQKEAFYIPTLPIPAQSVDTEMGSSSSTPLTSSRHADEEEEYEEEDDYVVDMAESNRLLRLRLDKNALSPALLVKISELALTNVKPYTRRHRLEKVLKFKQKKNKEGYGQKRVVYECRKAFADARPRVGGRFVKKTPEEKAAQEAAKAKAKAEKKALKAALKAEKFARKQAEKELRAEQRRQARALKLKAPLSAPSAGAGPGASGAADAAPNGQINNAAPIMNGAIPEQLIINYVPMFVPMQPGLQ